MVFNNCKYKFNKIAFILLCIIYYLQNFIIFSVFGGDGCFDGVNKCENGRADIDSRRGKPFVVDRLVCLNVGGRWVCWAMMRRI